MASNYINEAAFVAVLWVCLTITYFFVLVRLLLQYYVDRKWHTHDALILAAWLLSLANCIVWSVFYKQLFYVGTLITGSVDYSKLPANIRIIEEQYLRSQLAGYLLSYTSLWLVKLSFIFFFRHLGNRYRAQRILWWAVLTFVIACYGGTLGSMDYACEMASFENIIGQLYPFFPFWSCFQPNRAMKQRLVRVRIQSGTNVYASRSQQVWILCLMQPVRPSLSLDFLPFNISRLVIVLSGHIMWRVKINVRRKLALIGVSFLTAFIIIIALVRLELSVSGTGILSPAWLVFWNAIEICVAIMMACLASFWTFYTKLERPSQAPRRRAEWLPPRGYASLERPILLDGRLGVRCFHNHSDLSVQSHTSLKMGHGALKGKTEEP
ncbi:hypothetical protein AnigIFM59636_000722 [Aspergillus niger]|nr:hypothetical protein AnigIFM59636_000722 [Aspergillus niger]